MPLRFGSSNVNGTKDGRKRVIMLALRVSWNKMNTEIPKERTTQPPLVRRAGAVRRRKLDPTPCMLKLVDEKEE